MQKLRPQLQEDARHAVSEEGLPASEGRDLFFGEPVAHPFHGLFGQTIGMDRVEPGKEAQDAALEPGLKGTARDPREAAIGTLNRWLVSLDRMKGNA